MIISQLSIAPLGRGSSVSKYVKLVIQTLEKENVKFETNAMATVIETNDLDINGNECAFFLLFH